MTVFFMVGKIVKVNKRNSTTHLLHKLEILYSSLHSVIISKNESVTVYIRMLEAPLLFHVVQDEDEESDSISVHDLRVTTMFFRAVDLYKDCPPYLKKEFSMNTVIKLEFKKDEFDCFFGLMVHCKNVRMYFAPVNVVKCSIPSPELKWKFNDFECYYALQCLLTYSYEFPDQLTIRGETETVKKFLLEKSIENPIAISEAIYLIFEALVKGNVLIFLPCLKLLYERLKLKSCNVATESFSTDTTLPKHLLLIKRAIITPTHLVLLPPQPTLKSRALRDCDPSYSLRLSIRDVNMWTLNFTIKSIGHGFAEKSKNFFDLYYREYLLKGLQIGNRCYKYVGSSTSQMKGHGLWYYAKDTSGKTSYDLRSQVGEVDKIRDVPKFMARMGMAFSQSMGNIKVPQCYTNINNVEDDIEGGVVKYMDLSDLKDKNDKRPEKFLNEVVENGDVQSEDEEKYTFSDGVGRISLELAEEVYKELNVSELRPSAMQIRYAGCKGMLVVDPTLQGKSIMFRKSMKKFESDHESLELLKFSEKRSAILNRPFITILEQLGVKTEVFLHLQKTMIQNHITAMFKENEAFAFLHRHSLLRLNFLSMYDAKINFTENPLFRSMIYALFQKQIELLKKKANIEIPLDKGRNMFGVMDETFTLEYGQVFLQYSDWETNAPKIVQGTVVVTKNPCMHPGDVRKLEAVDVPALHHIRDCIVFPAKGPRPHPDEMAGSDLDGDEYHVIWLKDLIFSRENHEAMDFAIRKIKKKLDRDVEVSDELDHLCDYIFNDRVGLIASAHLVHADQNPNGIFSDVCLRLTKQYSLALDFAKTGIPVFKSHADTPKNYPDFMLKLDKKQTYLSTKTLGVLFRSCKRLELGLETERNEIDYRIDNALVHPEWDKKYKKSALRLYKKYCEKIEFYLRTYGFESEGQLLAGALINPPNFYQNRNDLDNLMAMLEYEVRFIFQDLQKRFFEEFGEKPQDGHYSDAMMQKASAWYMVSYCKDEKEGCRFFGMPWAVTRVLVQLKRQNADLSAPEILHSKSILEEAVDRSVSGRYPQMTHETDSETILNDRLEVLDLSHKILSRWVKSQRDYFTEQNIEKIVRSVAIEFDRTTTKIRDGGKQYLDLLKRQGQIKMAISPGHQVIEALLHIAKLQAENQNLKVSDYQQEIGLMAWMTLIKLACTYNPQYLGIPNEAGQYAHPVFYQPQDNIIDTIQIPIFDVHDDSNMKFSEALTKYYHEMKKYFIQVLKIKDIDFRFERSCAIVTIQGTRYSIENLKDKVVMKEFYDAVVSNYQ